MRRILTVLIGLAVAAAAGGLEVGDTPAVSVRTSDVRSFPGFLSPIVARVEYGETVEVTEVGDGWVRVLVPETGDEGWLHSTAVAARESLRLERAGDSTSGATSREIALAGRGFNEQVEQEYRSTKGLDFGSVDQMEAYEVAVEALAAFLADANLGANLGLTE
jgi:hypothetical protein